MILKTLGITRTTMQQYIPEDLNLHQYCSENLRSCKVMQSQLCDSSIILCTKISTADLQVLNYMTPKQQPVSLGI